MVANGLGWGLLPELQTQAERERGELIDLVPGQVIDVPLYWHSWRNGGDLLTALTRHLESQAACWLVAT